MNKPNLLQRLGRWITRIRNFVLNGLFLALVAFLIMAGLGTLGGVVVPDNAALQLNPAGRLVEETWGTNPFTDLFEPSPEEPLTNINDLVRVVDSAAEDERIRMILLKPEDLSRAAPTHALHLGQALQRFQAAGKEVLAYGRFYDQSHYAIASYADAVYLHPFGGMRFDGYGVYPPYIKGLLDKLNINVHVFRVGQYKDAVEPFIEEAMSPASREANQVLVDELWAAYRELVIANRQVEPETFDRYAVAYDQALVEAGGDMARLALEHGLVDELMTEDQLRDRIASITEEEEDGGYPSISYQGYLQTLPPDPPAERNVGLVFARGVIEMGDDRAAAAADNLVDLIREARRDETVAALVLRIDSPGGSAFASELIRQELELTQLANKPVVASMGPVAASGGYWIASTADQIIARPTTITGSIGVFGLIPTFEKAATEIGVNADGVGSLPLSGGFDVLQGLSEPAQRIIQAEVKHVYDRFINLAAKGRNMAPAAMDEIAQGRVWLGGKAQELGLVDEFGGLADALDAAAALAELDAGDYGVKTFTTPVPPFEALMQEVLDSAVLAGAGPVGGPLATQLRQAWTLLQSMQDPADVYALCETCLGLSGGL